MAEQQVNDLVNIEIDGRPLQARKGAMIIEVADAHGITIPRFCYHEKLPVAANCRMCLVEVERAPKPLPACATPVMEGMKVHTASARAREAQRAVMEFLLINHPLDCPICDQGGECELQDLALGYGKDVSRFSERKRVVADQDIGPLVATEMTRCIHCTRCLRFGQVIAGMPELGGIGRGENTRIGTFVAHTMESELSGNIIDLCPVGALTSKPFRFRARAWEMRQVAGVAPHDPVGSNIDLHVRSNRVLRVVPRANEAINEVWLSDRDRFSYEGLYSPERLLAPRIKRDGEWYEVDWEEALEFTVAGLRAVLEAHGPAALGALLSPSATSEEFYLAQKLVRALGSGNVDHRLRQLDFSDDAEAPLYPGLGQPIAALEEADAVLLVGSWTRKEHPLINHRLRKAVQRGAAVMAIGARARPFNYTLAEQQVVSPAALPAALAALAAAAPERAGLGELLGSVDAGEQAEAMVGRLQAAERAAILLGPAVLNHPQAAALRALAAALAEATGSTLGYLTEGANAAGAWLAGALPQRGPGGRVASLAGLDAARMLDGGLRAALLLGVEPEYDCAHPARALETLRGAELVVSLAAFAGERAAEYADVLLPVAAFAETPGSFVNAEGRSQRFAAATRPPGQARPAWRVLRVLGTLLELEGFAFHDIDGLRAELEAAIGEVAQPDNAAAWRRPERLDLAAGNGAVWRVGELPIHAVDALVRRAPALQRTPDAALPELAVSADLAAELGVEEGAEVRVAQNGGEVRLRAAIDPRLAARCVRLPAASEAGVALGPDYGPIEIGLSTGE